MGLLGGVVAAWLGDRVGFLRPIVIGMFLNVVPAVWYVFCDDGLEFAILYIVWSAAYYFVTPYFYAALARLDILGRWVVAMEAAWTGGDALGPWAAGVLVEHGGYLSVGGLVLVTGLIGLVILVSVTRRLDSMEDAASVGQTGTVS